MPSDGNTTRRSVLAAMGSAAATGSVVGSAVAQESGRGGSRRGPAGGRGRGRARQSPTSVSSGGVTIEFETCQVAAVTGDVSPVEITAAFEYYDSAMDGTTHHWETAQVDLPIRIDATRLGDRLPDSAETVILGEVEVTEENGLPLTSLSQPAQWNCRTML